MENKKQTTKFKKIGDWTGWKKLGYCFLLAGLFLILFSQNSLASIGEEVSEAMATAFYELARLAGALLGLAMWFVNIMVSADFYEKVLFSDGAKAAINIGWQVVRDFLNLFFILMLLLIAIGTILRVPSYGDKKMVFSVVISALLINFSKPIALVFIDISQLAMTFFIGALDGGGGDSLAGKILTNAGLAKTLGHENIVKSTTNQYIGYIIIAVVAIIFFLVMAAMLFVLAATLLVRVVAFWILIILSPLAMFGLAMPRSGLGSLQRDWFQKMLHWSFFGPVQLFFLWLAVVILQKVLAYTNGNLEILTVPSVNVDNKELVLAAFQIIIPYTATIYLLFYGYDMAKSVSVGGAQKVMNWGEGKIKQYGQKLGKWSAVGVGGALALTSPVGMGLAAAGAGSYYGGRSLLRNVKDHAAGARERLGESNFLFRTKKQKEEKEKEKREERIARVKGGEEEKKYWRGRANKQKKEWDDLGVDDDFLKGKMKNGNQAEKKAAALLLAEKGKINKTEGAGGFQEALEAIKGDKVLEAILRKKLKEENIYAFMTHDIETNWEAIQKTETGSLYEKLGKNDFLKGIAKNEGVNTDDQAAMTNFLTEYKNGTKNRDHFKQAAYDKQLDELTPKQIANQNNLLYEKENVVLTDYFAKKMSFVRRDGGTKSRREFEKELDRQNNGWRSKKAREIIDAASTDPRAVSRQSAAAAGAAGTP